MTSTKINALSARYPHYVSVDPSLAYINVQEGYVQGYLDVAMLTLVLYNACYVAIFHW